ncbi:MAG: hypothetical protein ABIG96_02615 [Candidatus Micrarchaeota archaeon]
MILEAFMGVMAGISGAVPFIHTNLVLQIFEKSFSNPVGKAVFAISTAISHSFFEIFPTIMLLGMGKAGMHGKGFQEVLAISLKSFAFCIVLLPLFVICLPAAKAGFSENLKFLFLAIVVSQLINEKSLRSAVVGMAIFLLSGVLGLVTFYGGAVAEPLFPMLSGFFAVPALLFGINREDGKAEGVNQNAAPAPIILMCVAASAFSTLFPALTVGVLLGVLMLVLRDGGKISVIVPSLLVSKVFYDVAASAITGKTRSYAAVLARPMADFFGNGAINVIAAVSIVAACFSVLILAAFSKKLAGIVGMVENRNVGKIGVAAILIFVAASSGLVGILLGGTAASMGIVGRELGAKRSFLMGSLIVPAICYQFGMDGLGGMI